MTGDVSQLNNIQQFNGGYISFAGGDGGKITQKGTVSNGVLSFENVNYAPELKHSLLSVSQIADRDYTTVFTKKDCLILKPGFVIPEDWILVRAEREGNAYILDMNNNIPENVTCLLSKVAEENAMLWHRRLGHANAKNLNRLAKNNLVRELPIKDFITFEKCVACAQGKHHRKPHKPKLVNTINTLLQLLHMDLFGPVDVMSISRNSYCLVIIDDFSRFTWVFFLSKKSDVTEIVKRFIVLIENQTNEKVKGIRCDNGTEFKNAVLDHFCHEKGIQRQYSAARTPQQNGVAERRNRTLIDAARTMLCDSNLPVFFWAEAINTACYVQNRVLINKHQMKTPYEILHGTKPSVAHFRTFGCLCTLLTLEQTPKFNQKGDECYFVGYAARTAYRVYNKSTRQIVESYEVRWLEENQTDARTGPNWLFDYATLFKSFNVFSNAVSGSTSGTKPTAVEDEEEVVIGSHKPSPVIPESPVVVGDAPTSPQSHPADGTFTDVSDSEGTTSTPAESEFLPRDSVTATQTPMEDLLTEQIPEEYVASTSHDVVVQAEGNIDNFTNLPVDVDVIDHPIPTSVQRDHPIENVIGSLDSGVQTRSQSGDVNSCLFSCFISQIEPKNVQMALNEPSWVDAMHEELNQFERLNVWQLVELPKGKKSLDTR